MGKTVILGASGATGKAITRELSTRGANLRLDGNGRANLRLDGNGRANLRLVGRTPQRIREAFPKLHAEILAADLETEADADCALAGVDTAIMTLGLPYTECGRYPALMKTVVRAADRAGVKRFLLVTSVYACGMPQTTLIDETHPRQPHTFKGRMRLEQERILEASGLEWLILRLPDFYGPEAELSHARLIMEAALAGKTADAFYPATTPHQFVYTPDVGPIVADLLERPDGWCQTYNFAGSGEITVADFARKVYAAAGKPLKLRVARKWMVRLLGLFSPLMRELVEMMYLHETPVNLSDAKLERFLGPLKRTPYDQGIAESLAWMKAHPLKPMPQ